MTFITSYKKIKTNKRHRCFGCGREFPSHTNMICVTQKGSTVFKAYYCMACDRIVKNERGDLYNFGDGNSYIRATEIEAEQALKEKEQ